MEGLPVIEIRLPSHDHLHGYEREAFRKAVNLCYSEFAKQCCVKGISVNASFGHDIDEFESASAMFLGCWADNKKPHQVGFIVNDDNGEEK